MRRFTIWYQPFRASSSSVYGNRVFPTCLRQKSLGYSQGEQLASGRSKTIQLNHQLQSIRYFQTFKQLSSQNVQRSPSKKTLLTPPLERLRHTTHSKAAPYLDQTDP
jgi:hypothetical protein